MYRNTLPWHQVFSYAFLIFIFYPIVPLCSFLYLLYKKPKSAQEPVSPHFEKAQYMTTIVNAMTGGLESPIQLIFQVWLVLNGVIVLDWNQISSLSFTDLEGNTIYLPYTASLNMFFSIISILKALLDFNVSIVHVKDILSSMCISIMTYLEFLPFLATSAFFKIASLIGIMTYLQILGFIPLAVIFISSIVINQIILKGVMNVVPNRLIMFMSIFVPACFNTKNPGDKNIAKIQGRIFIWQSITSFLIYGSTITIILIMVNNPKSFKYNEDIILNNQQFNAYGITILVMGLISTIFSFRPRSSSFLKCLEIKSNNPDVMDSVNNKDGFAICFKAIFSVLLIGIGIT